MLGIALFAIIGAVIHAPVGYWIVYGAYCVWKVLKFLYEINNEL